MDNNLEIPVIETPKIKVYAKVDSNKVVTEVNSSIFVRDSTGFIQIDEGYGDKYSHSQSQYLKQGLTDEKNRYNYKYDTALVELTEEEKNILFPPVEPPIDPKDILIAELSISLAETQSQGAQAIAELTKAIAMLQTPIN